MVFLNDRSIYNERYRSHFMAMFSPNVCSLGLFDHPWRYFYSIMLGREQFFSSNIKSNLAFSLFFWVRGVVVVNGLGRYRSSGAFRLFCGCLFSIDSRKIYCFQNYADYRFFSAFFPNIRARWVPGSGGVRRRHALNGLFGCVTRPSKYQVTQTSISDFGELVGHPIYLIGVSKGDLANPPENVVPLGFKKQDEIFDNIQYLLSPRGFGEGIPHVVVDALCSSMRLCQGRMRFLSVFIN